ncbi:beta-glucosidase [Phreatobacter cathodiphilus]|nr:beta-glucosidase [Phreatobacter cathodiphilus]
MADAPLFKSFFMAGFECATHRRRDGRRLDLLAATGHDRLAAGDYRTMAGLGLRTVRDGLRWHLIEQAPGVYDWSSALPMLRAAREADVQVIWDLFHFGWPDGLDIWSPDFVERFARFSAAAAELVVAESDGIPLFCVANEMSFLAWAGGDVAAINPCARQRGRPLKEQLVRAAVAAIDAIRAVQPSSRFLSAEPAIHIHSYSRSAAVRRAAETYRLAQFEALDMMAGRVAPELGGREDLVDIVGLNYYPRNQWLHRSSTLPLGHHGYRPFSEILQETFARYGRPIIIAETGAERSARSSWLHYVSSEVRRARAEGVPVEGICLYPVLDYPGWDDGRLCETGLLTMPDARGERSLHAEFAEELAHQQARFAQPTSRSGRG